MPGSVSRLAGLLVGLFVLALSVSYLVGAVDTGAFADVVAAIVAQPAPLAAAVAAYAAAFAVRSWAWRAVLPGLRVGQAWAALHVSLLGNHMLPLRLGEVLRVASVLRRTNLDPGPVTASALVLRSGDVLAVLGLAALAAPGLVMGRTWWTWIVAALVTGAAAVAVAWSVRLARRGSQIRLPTPAVLAAIVLAWLLEATVIWQIAHAAGLPLSFGVAVGVTAATIAAQVVAVTPGGIGTYEAVATAALVAAGVPAGTGFGLALTAHAVKTLYALVSGAAALIVPAPAYWGRLRLPRRLPARPAPATIAGDAPVVAMIPARDEEATIGDLLRRLPRRLADRPVIPLVVDDGSVDRSAQIARAHGARVVSHAESLGLGAAVRCGLAEATLLAPACIVYLDADLEYDPEELPVLAEPVLSGTADYVVGSRFAGRIRHMHPHRRLGNKVLTAWVRWMTRRRDLTDGQSGYRAFSPAAAAAAEIVHDYNYAQVLTLDLLGKGFGYAEVPISYAFRTQGESYVRLGRYLRRVIPAVYRELNADVVNDWAVDAAPCRKVAHPSGDDDAARHRNDCHAREREGAAATAPAAAVPV